MEIEREIKVNIKKTVERSVANNIDFHFYVDELSQNDYMLTYSGRADEKYSFDEMNEEFFEFLEKKSQGNGIFIRLVFAEGLKTSDGAVFELEYASSKETFKTDDTDNVLVFECADYGIKVQNGNVTFGATVDGGCSTTPYFAPFGSDRANIKFLSLDNPLNRHVLKIMENLIVADE